MTLNIYTLTFNCSELWEADGIWDTLFIKSARFPFAAFERPQPMTITIMLTEYGFAYARAGLSTAILERLRESVAAPAPAHEPIVVADPPQPSSVLGLPSDARTTIRKRGRPRKQSDQAKPETARETVEQSRP